jgi:hypothetical protein
LALIVSAGVGLASFDAACVWADNPFCSYEAAVYGPCVSDTCLATCSLTPVIFTEYPDMIIGYTCSKSNEISAGIMNGYFFTDSTESAANVEVSNLSPCTVSVETCTKVYYTQPDGSIGEACTFTGSTLYEAPTYETVQCPDMA